MYSTIQYTKHYGAYEVSKGNQYRIVLVSDLKVHDIMHKYIISSHVYVVVRSYHHIEFTF